MCNMQREYGTVCVLLLFCLLGLDCQFKAHSSQMLHLAPIAAPHALRLWYRPRSCCKIGLMGAGAAKPLDLTESVTAAAVIVLSKPLCVRRRSKVYSCEKHDWFLLQSE